MYDELRRVALFTSGVAELTRHQAEKIVKDFVKNGEVRRKQASGAVKELMQTSKAARQELARLIRSEIQNQIEGLGLATQRDLQRLERRVARVEGDGKKKTTARKTTSKKKTTSKSTAAKKSTAGSRSNPAKKTSTSS